MENLKAQLQLFLAALWAFVKTSAVKAFDAWAWLFPNKIVWPTPAQLVSFMRGILIIPYFVLTFVLSLGAAVLVIRVWVEMRTQVDLPPCDGLFGLIGLWIVAHTVKEVVKFRITYSKAL